MEKRTVSKTIAGALYQAGVKVVTFVPGAGGNEVFADFNSLCSQPQPLSFHEEPTYSIAHGAAIMGTRSAALFKSHGLIKAGNSVTDSLYCGVTAGMLALVFSDKTGQSSDSILDIGPFLQGIGLPYQNADLPNIDRQIHRLLEQSESQGLPQALVIESGEVGRLTSAAGMEGVNAQPPVYQRDITRHVLCPFFAQYQYGIREAKYHEQDWRQMPQPVMPQIPGSVPERWQPLVENYSRLFRIFRQVKGQAIVTGEPGVSSLFACEPYNCIDITTYLGGSVPLAVGAFLGGATEVWAVTGDFAFIAAGHLGLIEARQRQIPLKVLILFNGESATTGGQRIPEDTLERFLSGYRDHLSYIQNPADEDEAAAVLGRAQSSRKLEIVIADYRKSKLINARTHQLNALKKTSPIGVELKFTLDGNIARAEFSLNENHRGHSGFVHDGILAFLMDVAMGWISRHGAGVNSVTARMEIAYHQPAPAGQPLVMTSSITKNTKRLLEVKVRIEDKAGTLIAEGSCLQFIMGVGADSPPAKEGFPGVR
jgi:uncharacterized protein (TIGR00369 family)